MIALLGPPPKDILERGSWSNDFFDESGKFKVDVGIATTSFEDEMKVFKEKRRRLSSNS
jgi:serine/threonine-protein kinase SRPK3